MYPGYHFLLFPPFPRNNNVFVAMSFDDAFQERWRSILKPAIEEVGLEPYRIDAGKISNSIMHEILDGIGQAKLFLADISSVAHIRNGNVMYEVGIAHATRLPEEVILFRNDHDSLPFDVQGININSYDPYTNPTVAKGAVKQALREAMAEVNLGKNRAVERAIQSLDAGTYYTLFFLLASMEEKKEYKGKDFLPKGVSYYSTITRLQELGLISTKFLSMEEIGEVMGESDEVPEEIAQYSLTYFGKVVFIKILKSQADFRWLNTDEFPSQRRKFLKEKTQSLVLSEDEVLRLFLYSD